MPLLSGNTMNTMINIERLKIYRSYGGDIDGVLRINNKADLDAFAPNMSNIWAKITSVIQDMALIEKGLASKEYANEIINEMKVFCDKASFDELTKSIISKN